MEKTVRVRKGMILCKDISAIQLRIYLILVSKSERGQTSISHSDISALCGNLSKNAVFSNLDTLRRLGLINWTHVYAEDSALSANLYEIIDYRDWAENNAKEEVVGYIDLPVTILYDENLTSNELRLFIAIWFGKGSSDYRSARSLYKLGLFSEPTILKLLNALSEKKLIERDGIVGYRVLI